MNGIGANGNLGLAGRNKAAFLMPRKKRAVRYAGRCPAPRFQGDTPWTPGPLSLVTQVSERSSPSRVRCGKSFQPRKRFSSAAPKTRALDGSGPFPRWTYTRESGRTQTALLAAVVCLPLVGPELHNKFGIDKSSQKEKENSPERRLTPPFRLILGLEYALSVLSNAR